jgi:hypothetical protein
MPRVFRGFATWIDTLPTNDLAAGVTLLLAVLLFAVPGCYRWITAWARSRWSSTDTVLAFAALIGVLLFILQQLLDFTLVSPYSAFVATAGSATIVGLRLIANMSSRLDHTSKDAPLFDRVLNGHGLDPLKSEDEDELQRGKLLDELYALVVQLRSPSLNFGLEGAWGSGKTSLLNLLRNRLSSAGFTTVMLDLWSYREPHRLVQVYFARLAGALAAQAPQLRTRSLFRRLAAGLAELGGSPVAKASKVVFGDLAAEPLETTLANLAKELQTLSRPVIVFLDDLDRLDRDELMAVLRSIRLTSDLPNLTQVLAYDREQLARTLFPDDPTGTRARDHIGKIINCEFTIGTPPRELVTQLLERSLAPFLEALGEAGAVDQFLNEVRSHELRFLLMEALPTPREVRRVVAATAGRWEQMSGHVNPFDLFVLTIIQYRFPSVYQTIRASPEWFVELEWSQDPFFRIVESRRKVLRGKGVAFARAVAEAGGSESTVAAQLLDVLFPHLQRRTRLDADSARRERRIAHPGIADRYFHLYVAEKTVSEAEIEHYADELKAASAGMERRALLKTIVSAEAARGRLDSFLDQWSLVFGRLPGAGQHEAGLVQDLSLGLAESAQYFSEESGFLVRSQCEHAAYKVLFLSLHLPDANAATRLLVDVIHRATRLSFACTIVIFSPRERRPDEYRAAPEPDRAVLEEALSARVLDRFSEDPRTLLSSSRPDRAAALRGTGENDQVARLFVEAVRRQPALLPRLVELVAPVRTDSTGTALAVDSLDIRWLASRIDLQEVYRITAGLPLETWPEEIERDLVERFRTWILEQPEFVAGGAPAPAST